MFDKGQKNAITPVAKHKIKKKKWPENAKTRQKHVKRVCQIRVQNRESMINIDKIKERKIRSKCERKDKHRRVIREREKESEQAKEWPNEWTREETKRKLMCTQKARKDEMKWRGEANETKTIVVVMMTMMTR